MLSPKLVSPIVFTSNEIEDLLVFPGPTVGSNSELDTVMSAILPPFSYVIINL